MENKNGKITIKDVVKNAPKWAKIAKTASQFFGALALLSDDTKEYEVVEKVVKND